ncbi:polysaccharide biosynthesis protein [Polaribacter uvawellassae]|uniref:polysaccharide biosynthesis protein n=1 Tax=Polaribacter uvawellassae TaxID=3133495 RepID=UPI00321B9E9E
MVKHFFLKKINRYASKWLVLIIDIISVSISFVFAYFVRFNASFNFDTQNLILQIPLIIILSLISFLIVGSYKGIIRHTGTRDVFNVFLAATLLTTLTFFVIMFNGVFIFFPNFTIPISIIIIHYLVNIFILTLSRFIFKAFFEVLTTELGEVKHVLIYGAGDSGIITYGALNRDTKNNYEVVGFIDDDTRKINKKIDRIKIFSLNKITSDFIVKNNIDEIIISIQNVKPDRLLEITDYFIPFDVEVKIVPPLSTWIDGNLHANQIRDVKIEDLLDRAPIIIDNPILQRDLNDKIILVTGAAGSIGSEISRQLCKYKHKLLVLVDQAESDLYELQQELIQNGIQNFKVIVADVRDDKRMELLFQELSPQKVFHAAAYKHVPLMEESPCEAVKVNVIGTKTIADLSLKYNVERFVMVSTDKAVNPTNVMGATKRVAEMYISCLSKKSNTTRFTITRFGNVLGSNGSVIPLFKKQIANGGPLTVTHKDITRYFMTIPEACKLVLEAGTMGVGGEIYIFDMGKSVKIFDIAKKMIFLSGLKYPEDIDIKITGLRPGEKLYEELLATGENTISTYHEKIMIAKTQELDIEKTIQQIEKLCVENQKIKSQKTVRIIKELVPEYISNNSVYEKLDITVAN